MLYISEYCISKSIYIYIYIFFVCIIFYVLNACLIHFLKNNTSAVHFCNMFGTFWVHFLLYGAESLQMQLDGCSAASCLEMAQMQLDGSSAADGADGQVGTHPVPYVCTTKQLANQQIHIYIYTYILIFTTCTYCD